MLLTLRRRNSARGICFDVTFAHEELEKCAECRQMPRDRRAAQLAPREMREIRANGEVIDAPQLELLARHREVVVAEKREKGFEIVAVGGDGVGADVALVRQVIEELPDFALHPALPN